MPLRAAHLMFFKAIIALILISATSSSAGLFTLVDGSNRTNTTLVEAFINETDATLVHASNATNATLVESSGNETNATLVHASNATYATVVEYSNQTDASIFDVVTSTLIVSYSSLEGLEAITAHVEEQKKKGKTVGVKGGNKFKRAHKVKVKDKVGGVNVASTDTTILGYAVVSTLPNNTDDELNLLFGLPGVAVVEYDSVMTALDGSNLRGRAHDQIREIEESITTDELQAFDDLDGTDRIPLERRLAETVPYGINMVNASQLWAIKPQKKVKICVIDTGYDRGHPDLPVTGVTGWDTGDASKGKWYVDENGHGTHCAGTIGARRGNNAGVIGVNPDSSKFSFHIAKGLTDSGSGSLSDIMRAIESCAYAGAKVISMSLGGKGRNAAYQALLEDVYDKNILVVAAAGNSGSDEFFYPAYYKTVLSVASVTSTKMRSKFSTTNDQTELAAPGSSVLSTKPRAKGSYGNMSGTSMSAPHVAGVAALLITHFPTCTNNQIRNAMLLSASEPPASSENTPGWDKYYGWGIVNAGRAYERLKKKGCVGGGPFPSGGSTLSMQAYGGKEQLKSFF